MNAALEIIETTNELHFVNDLETVMPGEPEGRKSRYLSGKSASQRYMATTKFQPKLVGINGPLLFVKHELPAARDIDIALEASIELHSQSLADSIYQRRSNRFYGTQRVSLQQLSDLLIVAAGMSNQSNDRGLRTYPSGGGFYPINLYLAVRDTDGLESANYQFIPESQGLKLISRDNLFDDSAFKGLLVPNAAMMLFMAADLTEQFGKYGDLSYKLALLEAGHIAQNILLLLESLGLTGCPLQAYYDDLVNQKFALDGETESVCYGIEIGSKH